MLYKARDIIGMPIIEIAGGKQIGHVKDVAIDENWRIIAIVVDTKEWFTSPKMIAAGQIFALGDDAVTIQDSDCLADLPGTDEVLWKYLDSGDGKMKGKPVVTVNGNQLGLVEDVYFEEQMGKKIVGYELTDGFFSDLTEGRKWLPAPEQVTWGEDAIIVPLRSESVLEDLPIQ